MRIYLHSCEKVSTFVDAKTSPSLLRHNFRGNIKTKDISVLCVKGKKGKGHFTGLVRCSVHSGFFCFIGFFAFAENSFLFSVYREMLTIYLRRIADG